MDRFKVISLALLAASAQIGLAQNTTAPAALAPPVQQQPIVIDAGTPVQGTPVQSAPDAAQPAAQTAAPAGKVYTVPAGTKIPLSLQSAISTKSARPGDAVYLTSAFPVVIDGNVVIPAGVYVQGYVDGLQRAGRVKGSAQLMMHFVSMVFPNGVVIALPGAVDRVPGSNNAHVKDKEGLIVADGQKAHDAQTIATTTLAGASIGGIAGAVGSNAIEGVGIGAGAGAAVGVLATLFSHGQDITIAQGTTVVMVMQRPLLVQEQQLAGMPDKTGYAPVTPVAAQQVVPPMPKPGPYSK